MSASDHDGRLGSASPSPDGDMTSSSDQYPLLQLVDGQENIEDGTDGRQGRPINRKDGSKNTPAADLMRRLGVSPERRIKVTAEDDARVLHRIDSVVLPLMLAVYFLQGGLTRSYHLPNVCS